MTEAPSRSAEPAQAQADPNEVTLVIGGRRWLGWQEVRISRGIERCPNDFDLLVTERFPGADAIVVEPGQTCELRVGSDRVITGYVDRYRSGITYAGHKVRISGRGKCQDLVDCNVVIDGVGSQIGNAGLLDTARRLASPYGIEVESKAGDAFIAETLSLYLTETPFDVIERLARATGFLVYEGADGNLVLNRVSEERHATGFEQGVNVEAADVSFSMDQRFSEYRATMTALENMQDIAARAGNADYNTWARVEDRGVPRKRLRTIVVEQTFAGQDFARRRVEWEMARRFGRSQAISITVDSWRDGEGRLWEPNRLARVHIPALKLEDRTWTIGEVTFRRGKSGEQADIELMPPAAFAPQPVILQPFDSQVARAANAATPPANVPTSGATGGTP